MCIELFELLPQELSLEELCNKYGMTIVIPLMKNRYYISDETFLYYFLPLEDLEQSVDRNAMAALSLITRDETMIVAICGTKDWLYLRNLEFVKANDKTQLSYKFFEIEAGTHDAECFRESLRKAIEYITEE
ncbi:MAG: hypothetical protein J6A59_18020 [Lachnospiraceae bacterium]|nr:hypothetical protein [Lachnospiraceae bacterium]